MSRYKMIMRGLEVKDCESENKNDAETHLKCIRTTESCRTVT
jgi:hypothetical protein